ncbi:uncharacterized protein LOC121978052 [Zingiber officinale]|uniref:Uncharacterized protein n=1 Tax=Zingiber officinale TaxID=94328 RepID=A0A8J5GYZ2_ZINOF|nr:uncharacterized protein LOC121973869 [Zingiber officinale]XP_042386375.1 uncharacterized protein LOC121978052 [Zingiber officinale]KAG6513021.1 hypothetical protein ZIOFF_031167 [Zingiber officinale]KAG6516814.1 hypothetical protein ZIOFF_027294 [Zingiber officinale]
MMVKEGGADLLPSSDPKTPSSTADAGVFGKGRYRFWALAAILLLAFWSMLTGTVTLRWSAGDLNRLAHDFDVPVAVNPDLDVLEMEEREKAVRHMWDVYAHAQTRRIRLPRFWQEAFEAAYQDLSGDDPDARDAAVAEIARMSLRMLDPEAPPRNPKAAEIKRNQRLRDGISSLVSGSSSSDAR